MPIAIEKSVNVLLIQLINYVGPANFCWFGHLGANIHLNKPYLLCISQENNGNKTKNLVFGKNVCQYLVFTENG